MNQEAVEVTQELKQEWDNARTAGPDEMEPMELGAKDLLPEKDGLVDVGRLMTPVVQSLVVQYHIAHANYVGLLWGGKLQAAKREHCKMECLLDSIQRGGSHLRVRCIEADKEAAMSDMHAESVNE